MRKACNQNRSARGALIDVESMDRITPSLAAGKRFEDRLPMSTLGPPSEPIAPQVASLRVRFIRST